MFTIIVITLLIFVFTFSIFFVIRKTTNEIDNRAKQYFTRMSQEYINVLNEKKEKELPKEEIKEEKEEHNDAVICIENASNQYEVNNLFEIIKKIDKKFDIDYEKIIMTFSSVRDSENDLLKFNRLIEIRKYIDNVGVYNVLTSEDPGFINEFIENIKSIDSVFFDSYYVNKKKFDVQDFINYLENEKDILDPYVYVLVGDESLNYDYIGEKVKTIYNKKIYKGIKIIYKNHLFDYSLS